MKQFWKILTFELKYYLKNKVFIGVTGVMVLLLAGVMFFPRISEAFHTGEEGPEDSDSKPVMLICSTDGELADRVQEVFAREFPGYTVEQQDENTAREQILSGDAKCAFLLEDLTGFTYLVENLNMSDGNPRQAETVLAGIYRMQAMVQGGLTEEQAEALLNFRIEGQVENLGKDQAKNFFYTYIMIMALYMVIILYGQMVATNVASEKSSRAMELLITSANPTGMIFGKVLASCLAGFIQLAAVFGSALLFFSLNKSQWEGNLLMNSLFDMPLSLLVYMLVFFVQGFVIYAFLFGAVGSMASKVEDINTSTLPLNLTFMVGFLVVIMSMSTGDVDSTLMKICSYIPFTSPMAMFTRIAMGSVAGYGIAISIGILAVSAVAIGVLSAKIYRVGVLLYGTQPRLGAIIKAIRQA